MTEMTQHQRPHGGCCVAPQTRIWLAFVAALVVFATPDATIAHPLGMSSVNRYAGIRLNDSEIEIDYLLDIAELPAWAEIETLDADHDGSVAPGERERYLDGFLGRIAPTMSLEVNGNPVPLTATFRTLEAPPGQNGTSTLRIAVIYSAPRPDSSGAISVAFQDRTFANREGWRELEAMDSFVAIGLSVTIAHTASAFILGTFALALEHSIGTDRVFRVMEVFSGGLVMFIALWQLSEPLERLRGSTRVPGAQVSRAHVGHDHEHGHHHHPPSGGALRGLIGLGVSGGMVPCPSALVVLLSAISLHRLALGLAPLVACSLGLAAVLSTIGLVFVVAKQRLDRLGFDGKPARALPVLSSLAVLCLGGVNVATSMMG